MPVSGPVGMSDTVVPRSVPSGPIHNAGMQGQAAPPSACACSDSRTVPAFVVLNHSSVDIPPEPGIIWSGSETYEEVPSKDAPALSSNTPLAPNVTLL